MDKQGISSSIVDDVIAEFAPDEADREIRRRQSRSSAFHQMNCQGNVLDSGGNVSGGRIQREIKSAPTEEEDKVNAGFKEDHTSLVNAKSKEEDAHASVNQNYGSGETEKNAFCNSVEKSEFALQPDGSLLFYILDAHEVTYGTNVGTIYLFGKVKVRDTYQSCCVVVKNMQRCVYAIPKCNIFHNEEVLKLEKDASDLKITPTNFLAKLNDVASGLKSEIARHLLDLKISTFSMAPVKRNYAFDRSDIPNGENYVLKINYPFKDPLLPSDLIGDKFSAVLGTKTSALELFLVKRKIKGPSWLSLSRFSSSPSHQRVSWCKFEVIVDCSKDIKVFAGCSKGSKVASHSAEIPPVTVTSINLKTIINPKQNVHEIVCASIISCNKSKIDTPMLPSKCKKPGMLSHFTVIRKLEGVEYPIGFMEKVVDINSEARSKEVAEKNRDINSEPQRKVLAVESSERALLNCLIAELYKLDSDFLVGYEISRTGLDILLQRAQECKVQSQMWSKLGRLNRSELPKRSNGSNVFGSDSSSRIMTCMAGRLLYDTFLCSYQLKEVSYSLTQLAKTQLNKDRKEISSHDIPNMFQTTHSLMELIECNETDAGLSMELVFHMSVLPLTLELTNISGNLWSKTLQGATAQRVEYFLLHAFHAKKYIVPEKYSSYERETRSRKRKVGRGSDDTVEAIVDNEAQPDYNAKRKKVPAYKGGLVLEPKKGFYDKYILLLDFNSLYPSIIQEYDICFTTVERSSDGIVPRLPSTKNQGVLPELLRMLVKRRMSVKSWMKKASGLKVQRLDIQQQALKLTANSVYGCLGLSSFRFYAKPLAELITSQGREILQSTIDVVQNKLNLEVIYGDTDSIMINSGLDDIAKTDEIAKQVINEVKKKYQCLKIDLDGLYKRMLLLQKKKYAAVKVLSKGGKTYEVIEQKGLDMVRRDWSLLSKDIGSFCLSQILSGGACDDVVESIHDSLRKVQEDMRCGEVLLEKYVITKTLAKPPEAYPDAKHQPHVQVALRLKQSGYSSGCSAGDTIPYVICCEEGANSGTSEGIAKRARHPDEFKRGNGKLVIDIDYYLSRQIHPVVSRLCAWIKVTSPAQLAECLGLDSSKFQSKTSETVGPGSSVLLSDEERYQGCQPLALSCHNCSNSFECPSVSGSLSNAQVNNKGPTDDTVRKFWLEMCCPKCPKEGNIGRISPAMIANQVKRQADGFISEYYKGVMKCNDETCGYATCTVSLRETGDSDRGTICHNFPHCRGHLVRKYSEADLYRQLSYLCHLLDTTRCLDMVDVNARIQLNKELARVEPRVRLAATTAQNIRNRCGYGWVQLRDLFAF